MTTPAEPRKPRLFSPDDPSVVSTAPDVAPREELPSGSRSEDVHAPPAAATDGATRLARVGGGIRWGAVLLSATTALATLAAGVWFARFVSVTLARDDWVGWIASALVALIVLAFAALLLREIVGLSRLARLTQLRRDAEHAIAAKDPRRERAAVAALRATYAGRSDCRWAVANLDEHMRDVRDTGDLLRLADRDLMGPLDLEARRIVTTSAKRVAVVTAMSPMVFVGVAFVLVENVRMLGKIAALYGGRPGTAGALKLGRMVIGHLVASGGVALTEDLLGQFVGQDVLRRVSRRLGEGAFNGALTARIGAAATGLVRPLPHIETAPIRVRDIVRELFQKKSGEDTGRPGRDRG
jgi:putative membrane protein